MPNHDYEKWRQLMHDYLRRRFIPAPPPQPPPPPPPPQQARPGIDVPLWWQEVPDPFDVVAQQPVQANPFYTARAEQPMMVPIIKRSAGPKAFPSGEVLAKLDPEARGAVLLPIWRKIRRLLKRKGLPYRGQYEAVAYIEGSDDEWAVHGSTCSHIGCLAGATFVTKRRVPIGGSAARPRHAYALVINSTPEPDGRYKPYALRFSGIHGVQVCQAVAESFGRASHGWYPQQET